MRIKEFLTIFAIFCFLPTLVMAGESYDAYAEKGKINSIDNINVSNYVSTKNTFSGIFYSTGSGYKGKASFYTSGYLTVEKIYHYTRNNVTRTTKQSVSISLMMDEVTNCDSLGLFWIRCNGNGKMIIMSPKSMSGKFEITDFNVEILDGKVDISGGNVSSDLFSVTDMELKKFSPGYITIQDNSLLEITWVDVPQPEVDPPGVFPNILNFTPASIGNTTYALNNVWLKNVGNNSIRIYVCGENYPGIVEFLIKSGTRIFGWKTLPVCDFFQPFNNGTQIVPYIYENTTLPPGKEIVIYNSRITYNQNFTEGNLNFTIESF